MSYRNLDTAELAAYFARIGFDGVARPDLATLRRLHLLHPLAIAFENLDSWCGRVPSLDEAAVFEKLVGSGRGGYCFEHNQLFLRVLQTLGFDVHMLAARVVPPDATPLPRTHKVLLVTVAGEDYLVDVGFGGMTMTAPLLLSSSAIQTTPHEPWRLQPAGNAYLLSAHVQDSWSDKYRFSREPQTREDYELGNWYVAAHPSSRFRNDLIAARADASGRHALLNKRYSLHRPGQPSVQRELASPLELRYTLRDAFGLRLDDIAGLDTRLAGLFNLSDTR